MTALAQKELTRRKYLDAMGIATYVSRGQLPGAAPVQRLVVIEPRQAPAGISIPEIAPPEMPAARPPMPEIAAIAPARAEPAPQTSTVETSTGEMEAIRFSLATIFVGGLAFVEELPGRPLAREQVQLAQAMARALNGGSTQGKPEIAQFDWPMHNNHQLGLGKEAARASVSGFLQRQIDQRQCRGLVLLGATAAAHVPLDQLQVGRHVVTESTQAMLENPGLKRQVWQDLQSLLKRD